MNNFKIVGKDIFVNGAILCEDEVCIVTLKNGKKYKGTLVICGEVICGEAILIESLSPKYGYETVEYIDDIKNIERTGEYD